MIICALSAAILYLTVNSFSNKVKDMKNGYQDKKQLKLKTVTQISLVAKGWN